MRASETTCALQGRRSLSLRKQPSDRNTVWAARRTDRSQEVGMRTPQHPRHNHKLGYGPNARQPLQVRTTAVPLPSIAILVVQLQSDHEPPHEDFSDVL